VLGKLGTLGKVILGVDGLVKGTAKLVVDTVGIMGGAVNVAGTMTGVVAG
jgi:hypothetical protein